MRAGALGQGPIPAVRRHVEQFGAGRGATLIGGDDAAPDRAAFFNTALVRYLDFMDNFLAKGETCHPSDNFGAVLAAADYGNHFGPRVMMTIVDRRFSIDWEKEGLDFDPRARSRETASTCRDAFR